MDYEKFKKEILKQLMDYLPEQYRMWRQVISRVDKINGAVEALTIMPEEGSCAVPTLYFSKFYEHYLGGMEIEEILKEMADEFLSGLSYLKNINAESCLGNFEERIIFTLVNRQANLSLLEHTPHRLILDLALIYRVLAQLPDSNLVSTVITNEMAQSWGIEEETFYRAASKNTPKLLPPQISGECDTLCLITNTKLAMGAAVILYEGVLKELAAKVQSDLYILPSSIHEVFVIAAPQDVCMLKKLVYQANRSVVERGEVLSDQVYFYSRKTDCLEIAQGFCCK